MTTQPARGIASRAAVRVPSRAPPDRVTRPRAAGPAGRTHQVRRRPSPDPRSPPNAPLPASARILPLLAAAALALAASLALAATGAAATSASKACRAAAPARSPSPAPAAAPTAGCAGRSRRRPAARLRYRVTVERQAPQRDERAPPEGPRPPGPAAALQGRHDPRPALRPRAEGDREVLRADHAGERRRRAAVGDLGPAVSWAQSKNGDGKLAGYRVIAQRRDVPPGRRDDGRRRGPRRRRRARSRSPRSTPAATCPRRRRRSPST